MDGDRAVTLEQAYNATYESMGRDCHGEDLFDFAAMVQHPIVPQVIRGAVGWGMEGDQGGILLVLLRLKIVFTGF